MRRNVFHFFYQPILILSHSLLLILDGKSQLADSHFFTSGLSLLIINVVYLMAKKGRIEHPKAHITKGSNLNGKQSTPVLE